MTSGYILIGAMLILGGIIAVSGDRVGTRVGKARLSLFKLRPRQTATLVTIVTGTLISASVLTLIFGVNEQLRTGVFDLQKIQRKLSDTKENLDRALEQKDRVQRELEIARNAQSEAKNLLSGIDKSLKGELLKQSVAAQNFKNTEQQLQTISSQRNELVQEVAAISSKRGDLTAEQQVIAEQVQDLKQRVNELESDVTPLKQQLAKIDLRRSQLQRQLDTIGVEPNLLRQTQRLQTERDRAKKLERDLTERTARLTNLAAQLQTRQSDLLNIDTQLKQLDRELAVRQAMLREKDRQHQQLEREFQTRATQLKLRDQQLKKLEAQMQTNGKGLASLEKEVNNIEQEYQKIRQGNIGILRNQVLGSAVLRASDPAALSGGIDRLMSQANLNALKALYPDDSDINKQIIEIDPDQLSQLKQQINRRQDYVVRIFSIDNYVIGDSHVNVFADTTPDRKLFDRHQYLTSITINPTQLNEEQIRQQLNILLVKSQLRARRTGILDDRPQIGDGQLTTYVQFLDQVKKQKYPIEIRTIVDRDVYMSEPLVIKLLAISNNKVLFSTYSNASINRSSVH
jgi:uncharacterized protein (DUF3084 family)